MSENFDRSAFLSEELRSAIDDPKHENYLKFCFVCQEEAKPGQVLISTKAIVAKSLTIYNALALVALFGYINCPLENIFNMTVMLLIILFHISHKTKLILPNQSTIPFPNPARGHQRPPSADLTLYFSMFTRLLIYKIYQNSVK